jgi:hypothetical protein
MYPDQTAQMGRLVLIISFVFTIIEIKMFALMTLPYNNCVTDIGNDGKVSERREKKEKSRKSKENPSPDFLINQR